MLPEITLNDLGGVLDAVAAETLAAAEVTGPAVDARLVARRLGIVVAWDDQQTGRARLVNLRRANRESFPSILLKHDPRSERVNWATAHEIGEALAERIFGDLGIDLREAPLQSRETAANYFAARLLLPSRWFADVAKTWGWDLLELKQHFHTASHELIARRMLDFPTPIVVAIYDQNQLTWRKSNVQGRRPPASPRELACRSRTHMSGETSYDDGPPCIRAWPVHEADWKREIVRVEIDELAEDGS
ncbi:MAG TPA: ImmA/IrrE family metallo-endopeptidase [Pirellulales bacterium]